MDFHTANPLRLVGKGAPRAGVSAGANRAPKLSEERFAFLPYDFGSPPQAANEIEITSAQFFHRRCQRPTLDATLTIFAG